MSFWPWQWSCDRPGHGCLRIPREPCRPIPSWPSRQAWPWCSGACAGCFPHATKLATTSPWNRWSQGRPTGGGKPRCPWSSPCSHRSEAETCGPSQYRKPPDADNSHGSAWSCTRPSHAASSSAAHAAGWAPPAVYPPIWRYCLLWLIQ